MSKLSQQIVTTVLAQVGVRSNPETRRDAAINADAYLADVHDALISSQSILSLLHHRERSTLTAQSQKDVYDTLCAVERVVKNIGPENPNEH